MWFRPRGDGKYELLCELRANITSMRAHLIGSKRFAFFRLEPRMLFYVAKRMHDDDAMLDTLGGRSRARAQTQGHPPLSGCERTQRKPR